MCICFSTHGQYVWIWTYQSIHTPLGPLSDQASTLWCYCQTLRRSSDCRSIILDMTIIFLFITYRIHTHHKEKNIRCMWYTIMHEIPTFSHLIKWCKRTPPIFLHRIILQYRCHVISYYIIQHNISCISFNIPCHVMHVSYHNMYYIV